MNNNNPHQILGIAQDADEATIRRRYLELVREHSPERSPARFAEIRAAYDELRDPVKRLRETIFSIHEVDSLYDIIADFRADLRDVPIPVETLLSLGEG